MLPHEGTRPDRLPSLQEAQRQSVKHGTSKKPAWLHGNNRRDRESRAFSGPQSVGRLPEPVVVQENQKNDIRVAMVNLRHTNIPSITVHSGNLTGFVNLMLDSGAEVNLLKRKFIGNSTRINNTSTCKLFGITDQAIMTIGAIEILIHGYPTEFQIVNDDFPTMYDGVIGSEFFRKYNADIMNSEMKFKFMGVEIPTRYDDVQMIPPHSTSSLLLRVPENSPQTGIVPAMNLHQDIIIGKQRVKNFGGQVFIPITNTADNNILIATPTVEILNYASMNDEDLFDDYEAVDDDDSSSKEQYIPEDDNYTTTKGSATASCSLDRTLPDQFNCVTEANVLTVTQQQITTERAALILDKIKFHGTPEQETMVTNLITHHQDLFHLKGEPLGATDTAHHRINTTDGVPVFKRQYRFPKPHKEEIMSQVEELKRNGIIRPSDSPYNSPIWVVPKKDDAQGNKRWRMVVDYRALNEKTVGDAYPLPNITEILDQLGKSKYFSTFDLASGFHQIPIHPDDCYKTAFSTPYEHYEFTRMPFGLKNAPPTFQRMMDKVMVGLQGNELFIYMDDIVLYSETIEEHLIKFEKLAERLRRAKLQLEPEKCKFLQTEVKFLGHVVSESGVQPDPKKLEAVQSFPRPTTVKRVRQFLGLTGYYRRFVPNYAKVTKPLTKLLQKNTQFNWGPEQSEAFSCLRTALCKSPILQFPDFTKDFIITTDASNHGIGGILSQGEIGKDLPVAYISRQLSKPEMNYSTIEKEMLAIIYAVQQFRPYVFGRKFCLVTDHQPLKWLNSATTLNSRIIRWWLYLSEYQYTIVYKPGVINQNADALSRNFITQKDSPEEQNSKDQNSNHINLVRLFTITSEDSSSDSIFTNPKTRKRKKQSASSGEDDAITEIGTSGQKIYTRKNKFRRTASSSEEREMQLTEDKRKHENSEKKINDYSTDGMEGETSPDNEPENKEHPAKRKPGIDQQQKISVGPLSHELTDENTNRLL